MSTFRGRARAVLLLPGLVLLMFFTPATAHALSVSVPVLGLLGEFAPGGETRVVEWDVRQVFTSIDEIQLRLVAEDVSQGVCTQGIPVQCSGTSVLSPRVYTTEENRPPFFGATSPRSEVVWTTRPTPPVIGEKIEQGMFDGQPVQIISPIFGYMAFLEGRGFLDVDFRLIGDFSTDGSPGTITKAELFVIGTPVPAPATVVLVGLGLVGVVAWSRRRRGSLRAALSRSRRCTALRPWSPWFVDGETCDFRRITRGEKGDVGVGPT